MKKYLLLLLAFAPLAHAQAPITTQAIKCQTTVANGAAYTACPAPVPTPTPASADKVLWCANGGVSPGAALGLCNSAQWIPFGWMSGSWIFTADGWRVNTDVIFGAGSPPLPPVVTTGSAALMWTTPTLSEDGSPAHVVSYIVEYGQGNFASIQTTTANTFAFTGLATGPWQAQIKAVDADGSISNPTGTLFFTVVTAGQTCGPAPAIASQSVTCPAGTTGTWVQTHDWAAAAFPTCWTATAWVPTTPPAGACPAVVQVWKTRTAGEAVSEAVLPLTGTALVRGNDVGTIAVGKPCGAEQFKVGTASWRTITDADAALKSQTYAGRVNVALCTLQ